MTTHHSSLITHHFSGRRVLVTGANGFIGAWLIATLVELGAEVTGYDLSEQGALSLHPGLREKIGLVLGSTTDAARLSEALAERRVQTVYHLAANSNLGWAKSNPVSVFESNIQGSWCVLEACRQTGALEGIVVASSNTVYGEQQTREPFKEDLAFNPTHPYPASKACTDILARCYAAIFGMPIAVVRATNTYGGADPNLKRIVPDTCLKLLRGERPVILSDGSPEKGYLYVKDTVQAYLLVAARAAEDGIRGTAFNFHPARPTTVLELVRTIVKLSGRSDLEPEIRGKPGVYEYEYLSAERARQVLGWEPRFSLEAGLAETYAWYRDNNGTALETAADRFVKV
jgi:CDP-glucose 4,6-dehydratase